MASPPYPTGAPPPDYNDKGYQAPYPQNIGFHTNTGTFNPMPSYREATTENGPNDFTHPQFSSKNVRSRFVSRVYLILTCQLLFTTAVCAIFTFSKDVKLWVFRNQWIVYVSLATYLVSYFALMCCQQVRRGFPKNMICLSIFTVAFSFMVGTITAQSDVNAVTIALASTCLVVLTVSFLAACTPIDFTKCQFLLAIFGIVFFFSGIAMMITFFFFSGYIKILHLVYCSIGVLLFTLYLAYDTQRILGGKHIELSEEDYVEGAISLYIDIMQIFLFILQIVNGSRND